MVLTYRYGPILLFYKRRKYGPEMDFGGSFAQSLKWKNQCPGVQNLTSLSLRMVGLETLASKVQNQLQVFPL